VSDTSGLTGPRRTSPRTSDASRHGGPKRAVPERHSVADSKLDRVDRANTCAVARSAGQLRKGSSRTPWVPTRGARPAASAVANNCTPCPGHSAMRRPRWPNHELAPALLHRARVESTAQRSNFQTPANQPIVHPFQEGAAAWWNVVSVGPRFIN
jgi:hypothetical protein